MMRELIPEKYAGYHIQIRKIGHNKYYVKAQKGDRVIIRRYYDTRKEEAVAKIKGEIYLYDGSKY